MTSTFISVAAILGKMPELTKCRFKFMLKIFHLFILIPGRVNFLQMGRWGCFDERTYRENFEAYFDFATFNRILVQEYGSGYHILAFDPSFIRKSGKFTAYKGVFWSGCAQKALPGLEIGCCSVVDIARNTAYHLDAIPTPDSGTRELHDFSLTQHYAQAVATNYNTAGGLISNVIALDGYFAKRETIDFVCERTDATVVCKLRQDARLKYIYHGPRTGRQGAPRRFEGMVDAKNPRFDHFRHVHTDEGCSIHDAVVWSVSLKRIIRVALVKYFETRDGLRRVASRQLYFSTNPDIPALYIAKFYNHRFQQEFINRDAKQHTGLNDGQARSINKIDFHFNTACTAVNIAKLEHELRIEREGLAPDTPFSMANAKTLAHNEFIIKRIIDMYGKEPNLNINHPSVQSLLNTGIIAA
jgi:hypothetical protein